MNDHHVFSRHSCHAVAQEHLRLLREEVAALPATAVAPEQEASTIERLYNKYDIPPAAVERAAITIAEISRTVPSARRDDFYGDRRPEQSVKLTGVEFRLPFEGEVEFFGLHPSTSNILPNVFARAGYIAFMYWPGADAPTQTKRRFEADLARFEATLACLTAECTQFNDLLRGKMEVLINERKAVLEQKSSYLDGLGFPRA